MKRRAGPNDEAQRVAKGVKYAERLMADAPVYPDAPPAPAASVSVHCYVTDPKVASDDPPCPAQYGCLSEKGYYPGRVVFHNGIDTTGTDEYNYAPTGNDVDARCLIKSVAGDDLTVGRYYSGLVQGLRNGCPVVIVDGGAPAAAPGCAEYGTLRVVSASTPLTWDDDIVHVNAAAGNVTITLPSPAGRAPGSDRFVVMKKDASANTVTIASVAGQVHFAATQVFSVQGDSVPLYHDGTDWFIE